MEVVASSSAALNSGSTVAVGTTRTRKIRIIRMEMRLVGTKTKQLAAAVYISTNPSHVNPHQLQRFYATCNHSPHRFPKLSKDDQEEEDENCLVDKLQLALSHSALVVSVFCNDYEQVAATSPPVKMGLGNMLLMLSKGVFSFSPPSPSKSQLVGFGRAVSDLGLTASIHDVLVMPSLRRMGIGKLIVTRIVRMLTSRDIYDISAVCSPEERLFFQACGFRDDILGSTTMVYTRTVPSGGGGDHLVTCAGRKVLLIPPLKDPSTALKSARS